MLIHTDCPACTMTTRADARQLEPAPVQTVPGAVEFIAYCNHCGRALLARASRPLWEAETGRTAPPVEAGGGGEADV